MQMTPGAPHASGAWAHATLLAGRSRVQRWSVDSATPRARVVVGCAASCEWHVEAEGIQAAHLALEWNGHSLWITPLAGSRALVDGQALCEPYCVDGTTWLELGAALLILESSLTEQMPIS